MKSCIVALNEITGHDVAIKILNKKKIKMQGVFEKVKREIKVLRQFNHPHIIKHYEFIDTPSDIFMVIEFASGGELFDLIQRRERLTEEEARRFFQQIYSSIEYSHAHKIAHRDLKPENLLLDEHNNIKLIDFGLANSMKDSQALKTACGSPNYAAPEVISGRSYSGVEVDIWSLGVILFAMVCGSMPFDDDSMSALFNKIKEGKFQMPNYISPDVNDLINRMLQPNPVKRITMKEIKDHPWYLKHLPRYLQDLSTQHSRPSNQVDLEIVKMMFQLNMNLQGKTEEEVVKAIKEKKNTDFCGIYELFYHDKMKKECLNIQQKGEDEIFGIIPMNINSSKSSSSSALGIISRSKTFNTLRHVLIQQEEAANQGFAGSGVSPLDQHLHHHHYNPQNYGTLNYSQKAQQAFPMGKSPGNMNAGASKEFHSGVGNPCYSLLSQKHNDRLTRIIKKFRAGSFIHAHGHKILGHSCSSLGRSNDQNGGSSSTHVHHQINHQQLIESSPQQKQLISHKNNTQQDNQSLFIYRNPSPKHQKWIFGLIFKGTPIDLLTLSCEVLRLLDIEWQIIPQDLKMKCRSRIDENSVNEYEKSLMTDRGLTGEEVLANSNKDEMIKEFLRKNFVKFYINIYKDQTQTHTTNAKSAGGAGAGPNQPYIPQSPGFPVTHQQSVGGISNNMGVGGGVDEGGQIGSRYMLDIHLFKGTVYVFMDFVRKFMHVITSCCSKCAISNDCASSSNHSSGFTVDAANNKITSYLPNHIHDHNLKMLL